MTLNVSETVGNREIVFTEYWHMSCSRVSFRFSNDLEWPWVA